MSIPKISVLFWIIIVYGLRVSRFPIYKKDNKVYDARYDKEVYNPIDSTVSDME